MSARATSVAMLMLGLCGCALMPGGGNKTPDRSFLLAPAAAPAPADGVRCGTLQIAGGSGASGFRSRRMAYMRSDYQIEYFAYARWADAPARLLSEQARRYLDASGAFEAVLAAPTAAPTDRSLELSDVVLVQRFSGETSTVELALDARLYGADRAQVLRAERFEFRERAGADPVSGVAAANRAAEQLLPKLLAFATTGCAAIE